MSKEGGIAYSSSDADACAVIALIRHGGNSVTELIRQRDPMHYLDPILINGGDVNLGVQPPAHHGEARAVFVLKVVGERWRVGGASQEPVLFKCCFLF